MDVTVSFDVSSSLMFVCKIRFRRMLFLHISSRKRTPTADTYTPIKRAVEERAGRSAKVQHARVPPVPTSLRDFTSLSYKRISKCTCTESRSSRHCTCANDAHCGFSLTTLVK